MNKILLGLLAILMAGILVVSGCSTPSSSTPPPISSTQPSPPSSSSVLPSPLSSSTLPSSSTPPGTSSTGPVQTLEIGTLFADSGEMSTAEVNHERGSVLCAKWLNDNGGITINGKQYQITLNQQDTKSTADGTVAATNLLVGKGVKFIIDGIRPDLIAAVLSVTEPAKVITCSTYGSGSPAAMNAQTPYAFRAEVAAGEVTPNLYDYLVATYLNVRSVGIIDTDEPGGQASMQISQAMAASHNLTVAVTTLHLPTDTDYSAILTKVLAKSPDAIDFGTATPLEAANLLKTAREQGFKGPCFIVSPVSLYTIQGIVGASLAYDFFDPSLDVNNPTDMTPTMQTIQKYWNAKYSGGPFEFESVYGWNALWIMVQAIQKAQSLDPTVVKSSWETMTDIQEAWGPATFGGQKTYGINHLMISQQPLSRLNSDGKVEFVNGSLLLYPKIIKPKQNYLCPSCI